MERMVNTALESKDYFAALKFIEQLHKDGQIPAYMFRNILKDYADKVDITKFTTIDEREDAA